MAAEGVIDTSKLVSFEWCRPQPVSYNARDVLTYAVGIGCEETKWIYEKDPDFEVFPTYAVVLPMKGDTQDLDTAASADVYLGAAASKADASWITELGWKLPGSKVLVDAERHIEMVKPLPTTGARLEVRSRLHGIHKRGSGALIENEAEVLDPITGDVFYRILSGGFWIGAHSFRDVGRSSSRAVAVPSRAADACEEMYVSPKQAHIYRLSGDYNPLHIDPAFPGIESGGFRGPILHGLCTMGHAVRAVLKAFCGNSAANFKAVKVRFTSPVMPGETLITKMWKDGQRVIFTTEVKETGKVCIANAYLELATSASKL